jgi:thiamine biosynthesis lipoprotein
VTAAALAAHRFTAFGGAKCEIFTTADDAALSAAVADVYTFERRMTRFRDDSELSAFNRSAGEWVPVSQLLHQLLTAALSVHELTDGLVNAASLAATVAAGYDRSIEEVRRRPGPVSASVALPPLDEVLELRAGEARLRAGSAIDLGGIGKGWLADRLAERLEEALINLGGDLRGTGTGPVETGWAVGLCDGSRVGIGDAAVATSGTGSRSWAGGHHLIDPRTGVPARTRFAAVSVVAGDCVTAEALAKAALMRSDEDLQLWLRGRGALRFAAQPHLD